MKTAIIAAAFFVCATSITQAAEVWTCTHTDFGSGTVGGEANLIRFEVSPPDLIETKLHEPSVSQIEEGQTVPTVGATSGVVTLSQTERNLPTTANVDASNLKDLAGWLIVQIGPI
jgi:hypothetical protein